MELKLTHESICINETVYDGVLEQPVELDYLLPDYNPAIFKILKSSLVPKIVSKRVGGDKLYLDGTVYIKVTYVAEETNKICALEQKMPFSKTVDLKGAAESPRIITSVKSDYVNCRVVNPRRLDIRGAVTCKVSVIELKNEDIITDAEGMGVQLQKQLFSTGLDQKNTFKQFTVHEEIDAESGFTFENILNCTANAVSSEYRVVANKIVIKGDVHLHILYSDGKDDSNPRVMEPIIPVSQIIDMPGIDENYDCITTFDVISAELNPHQDPDGEISVILTEITLAASCEAFKSKEIFSITDMYSTGYESGVEVKSVKAEKLADTFHENCGIKESIETGQQLLDVFEVCCEMKNAAPVINGNEIALKGELAVNILGCDNDRIPCNIDKSIPMDIKLAYNCKDGDVSANCDVKIIETAFTLTGTDKIEVRCTVVVAGQIFDSFKTDVVTGINIDEQSPKVRDGSAALTIYYADEGERVWDIAKRYNTSVNAVIEENALEERGLKDREMILIPIMD